MTGTSKTQHRATSIAPAASSGQGFTAAQLQSALLAASGVLSESSVPSWFSTSATVLPINGLKPVASVWQIPTLTVLVPELDPFHNAAADTRDPIREIDQNITDRVALFNGDLVTLGVDVIVSSGNREMTPGHGVCAAIHLAAGTKLLEYCKQFDSCEGAEVRITPGYSLPAKAVIHAVGPSIEAHSLPTRANRQQLADCYKMLWRMPS